MTLDRYGRSTNLRVTFFDFHGLTLLFTHALLSFRNHIDRFCGKPFRRRWSTWLGRSSINTKLLEIEVMSALHRKSLSSSACSGRSLPGAGHEYDSRALSDMLFHRPRLFRVSLESVLSCVTMRRSPRSRNCSRVSVKYQHTSPTLLCDILNDLKSVMNCKCTSVSIESCNLSASASSIGFCIQPRNTTVLTAGSPASVTVANCTVRN